MEALKEDRLPARTLIGFDDSSGAHDAVALARILAPDSSAVLAYVLPHEDPVARHYKLLGYEDSPAAQGFFDKAVETLGEMEAEVRSYVGASPAHVLCDLAENEVDLVVVGSPHRGILGRALIGSVAQALLNGSPAPIVLAPRDYAKEDHASLRTIAVACDATPESGTALRQAEGLALAAGASLKVLSVVAPSAMVQEPNETTDPYAAIEEAIDNIDDAVEVHTYKLVGPVAETLANACGEDVDLLVTGSRDYGPLGRILVGSVSSQLIHMAPCPVLVVPRPSEARGSD
jgi:nucleotide-binding universal stress UspA family protein